MWHRINSYRIGGYMVCLVVGLVGGYLWNDSHASVEETHLESDDDLVMLPEGYSVKTAHAEKLSLPLFVQATGTVVVDPQRHVRIQSPLEAYISRSYHQAGDHVMQGELLADIESATLAEWRAEERRAQAEATLAQARLEVQRALYKKGASNALELARAEAEAEGTKIQAIWTEERLIAAQVGHSDSWRRWCLQSPIQGTVLKAPTPSSQSVLSGDLLYEIADLSSLLVYLQVPYAHVVQIQPGQSATVVNSEKQSAQALVERVLPILESNGQSIAIARIENQGSFYPGAFVRGQIEVGQLEPTFCVQESAVVSLDGQDHLFVMQDEGYKKIPVTVRYRALGKCALSSDLQGDEEIVTEEAALLKCEMTKREAD